jgi:hypothetical protein
MSIYMAEIMKTSLYQDIKKSIHFGNGNFIQTKDNSDVVIGDYY